VLVLVGYALSRWGRWPKTVSSALTRFTFSVAIPAFLFRLMMDFRSLPPVDARLLIAYFGGSLVLFVLSRIVAARVFAMDGVSQTIFAMGTIFSNNVLLGIPLAKIILGDASLPSVSLVVVFNSLVLWTLVTVSVEWARNRDLSLRGFAKTSRDVVLNPVVGSILLGIAFSFTGLAMPAVVTDTLGLLSQAAVPMSLIVLGMGLAEYGIGEGIAPSIVLSILKLVAAPLAVYAIARALALPAVETQAVVMLASLPVGANVYIMARQFDALQAPVATSLVLTTALAALTTPLLLAALA
jgi:malonate transporter and related proteins